MFVVKNFLLKTCESSVYPKNGVVALFVANGVIRNFPERFEFHF